MTHAESIRKRPGMYIGDTGPNGLHHLVMETVRVALARSPLVSEGRVEVTLSGIDGVRVHDHGTPIRLDALPTDATYGSPTQELPILLAALSTRLDIDVHADGVHWRQSFSRGEPLGDIALLGPTTQAGNTFTFRPDPEIFTQTTAVPVELVRRRLHELAAFYPGLRFTLDGETIHHPDGLAALFAAETAGRTPVHGAPITGWLETEAEGFGRVAFWWFDGPSRVVSFANGSRTLGGEHERGFLRALTRVLGDIPGLRDAQRMRRVPMADMVRAGLVAVIAVKLADPFYGAPTRDVLTNMEAFRLLDALTARLLDEESSQLPAVEAHLLAATPDPKSRRP